MIAAAILDFDDLRRVSRLGERATLARVEAWARRSGIAFKYDGRGGIWTTLDAMNAALGLRAPESPQATGGGMYDPSQVI
jgi:uncharacterized protein YigE (DUF2233 family)